MKKSTFILAVLIAMTIKSNAQIPNNGFENWGTITDTCDQVITAFDNPNGWRGSFQGPCTAPFIYSIQKNLDNYPLSTGLFSVIIKSDTAKEVRGIASTATGNQSALVPNFSITGHPTSLTGYYKFLPQNGDTMNIIVVLFQGGSMVAGGTLTGTATISNWTSFNVLISTYTTADSAAILLGSYNISGGRVPHGNSALYVDNLNFDNLITTGISEANEINSISAYPNPFTSATTLQSDNFLKDATLTVYNLYGQIEKQIKNISEKTITLHRDNLPSGMYFLRLTEDNKAISSEKLIITD